MCAAPSTPSARMASGVGALAMWIWRPVAPAEVVPIAPGPEDRDSTVLQRLDGLETELRNLRDALAQSSPTERRVLEAGKTRRAAEEVEGVALRAPHLGC